MGQLDSTSVLRGGFGAFPSCARPLWVAFLHVWYRRRVWLGWHPHCCGWGARCPYGALFKCLYHLYRLLGNYSRGEIFTKGSAEQIRQWGLAWTLLGVVKFAIRFLPRVVSIPSNMPLSEGLDGLDEVVSGLIIVAISWFMEMAAEMREENELTV